MPPVRLVAFAGSLRAASYNARILPYAVAGARAAGAEVTVLDLDALRMPLFDEDLEARERMPEAARRFRRALVDSAGYLIASPEYNRSMTAGLKNAIDWASRREDGGGDGTRAAFAGKVAGLIAASPGALGGLRGLYHLRDVLVNLGVLVVPEQATVSNAGTALVGDRLADEAVADRLRAVGAAVARLAAAVAAR